MIYDRHGQVVPGARVDWTTLDWTPEILANVPDDVMLSERQRRRAKMRTTYTGGVLWKQHNPKVSRCRCEACMLRRKEARAAAKKAKEDVGTNEPD